MARADCKHSVLHQHIYIDLSCVLQTGSAADVCTPLGTALRLVDVQHLFYTQMPCSAAKAPDVRVQNLWTCISVSGVTN